MLVIRPGWVAIVITALVLEACQSGALAGPTTSAIQSAVESAITSPSSTEGPSASRSAVVGPGEAWIVYQGAPQGLSLARPDGSGNHVILGPPGDQLHPDWSRDGSLIAYTQATDAASDIWITDPQGADPKPLLSTVPAGLSGLFLDNPAWSPDGSRIAAVAYEGNPQTELPARSILAVVDVESGAVEAVSELASSGGSLHSFPRWSPDGRSLVFVEDRFSGQDYLGGRMAVIRQTDSGWSSPEAITEVIDAPRGDSHPTDDLIVFGTNDVGGVQVTDEPSEFFTVRSDGSALKQITEFGPGAERATQPSWTSDGRIIFTYITGNDDEQLNVAFIARDGSGREISLGPDKVGIGNRPHPRLRPVP